MKKLLLTIISILFISLIGCAKSSNDSLIKIVEKDNYVLYAYDDETALSDYLYFVFDNNGIKIDSEYYDTGEPRFEELGDNILKVTVGAGTNVNFVTYYDLADSKVSEDYQNVYYDDSTLVAYVDYKDNSTFICVKELFGTDYLLNKELDLDGIMTTDYDVQIKNDTVIVKHAKGKNYENVVEEFELG